MNRYVVFHYMSGVYAHYQVYDKQTGIQRRILNSKILYCEKNHALLVPFFIYGVKKLCHSPLPDKKTLN